MAAAALDGDAPCVGATAVDVVDGTGDAVVAGEQPMINAERGEGRVASSRPDGSHWRLSSLC